MISNSSSAPTSLCVPDLDRMEAAELAQHLHLCCGSDRWIEEMLARRPYGDVDGLLRAASEAAALLRREDWLQAFSHHPCIGDIDNLRQRFSATAAWSEDEQASVTLADEALLYQLAAANRAYDDRFGFIFIVCASGKSAAEMLTMLQRRLGNSPDEEWRVAAREQQRITHLRLQKLVSVI